MMRVRGLHAAAQLQRARGAGVHDDEVVQPPDVGHVLVAAEHDVHAHVGQHAQHVAGVEHDVALAAGAGDRDQVVVHGDDLEALDVVDELVGHPLVALAADAAGIKVGLGRVQPDDVELVGDELGVARAPVLLEEHLAHVAGVVVAGDDDPLRALDPLEDLGGVLVLAVVAHVREVAGHDDDVGLERVHLGDDRLGQLRHELDRAAVEVGDLCDHGGHSLRRLQSGGRARLAVGLRVPSPAARRAAATERRPPRDRWERRTVRGGPRGGRPGRRPRRRPRALERARPRRRLR